MQPNSDPLISINAASRAIGVNPSTLWRQVKTGVVRNHDGKLRLSEVREDRAANLAPLQGRRHGQKKKPTIEAAKPKKQKQSQPKDDVEEKEKPETLYSSFTAAQARERNTIAELRELELQQKRGNLVDRAGVVREMYELGKEHREAWTQWPSRVAETMAARLKVDARDLLAVLSEYVRDHLTEIAGTNGFTRDAA